MSGPTAKELARVTDPAIAAARGAIRRMIASITKSLAQWQVTGVRLLDATEVFRAEVFGGVGVAARPATDKAEVIVAMIGGAKVPVIVAARDQATLAAVVRAVTGRDHLDPGELLLHTVVGGGCLYLTPDGIEARSTGGTAVALATKDDVQTLRDELHEHRHLYTPGTGAPIPTGVGPSLTSPAGTTKLKGE